MKRTGFTLIEIMIVVAIIGIIAAIAIPSYTNHVQKSRREAAKSDLLAAAQAMERFYAINYTYAGTVAGTTFPANSPTDGPAMYNLAVSGASATAYTITATPVSGGPQATDKCGVLSINQVGSKTPTTTGCW